MNNSDLFHSWVYQKKDYATGSNCSYSGKVCYSYRQPIGMLIKLGDKTLAVLSNSRFSNGRGNFSSTTPRHQNLAWRAVHKLYPVVSTKYDFRALVDRDFDYIFSKVEKDYQDSISILLEDLNNKRKKAAKIVLEVSRHVDQLRVLYNFVDKDLNPFISELVEDINGYGRFDTTFNSFEELYQHCYEIYYNTFSTPKAQKSQEEIISSWRNNKRQGLGNLRLSETILRYVPKKDIVQTSKGITFSTAQAKEFLQDIQDVVQSGVEKNVKYLGFYGVINPSGSIKIGCHEISSDEVFNLANQLQLC